MIEDVYDPSMWPGGRRRYLMSCDPHTLLSTGRLHVERMAFNNLAQLLYYWAHQLYDTATFAYVTAFSTEPGDKAVTDYWQRVSSETEMVLMIAEGAEVSRPVADMMIDRSLDAAREAARDYLKPDRAFGDFPRAEDYYPWFIPGFYGTGGDDPDRAADLAALEEAVADRLDVPKSERHLSIELRSGERWY